MNRFLASLSPSLRAEVEQALREEGGDARLRRFAGRYIDQDGRWPTNPATAEFIARQYVRESAVWTSARYASSGLASTTVAGMAGGALSIGAGKAGVVVGSNLMQNYWKEVLQYSTGISPRVSGAIYRMAQNITSDTSWREITRELITDPSSFDRVLGSRIASALEQELLGPMAQVAWRGARSALNHADPERRINDFSSENDWISSYVERFAQNQKILTERTVRQVINEALSQGKSSFQIAEDLQRLWKLTPQHANAVENYRRGLVSQQKRMGEIRRLTSSYADRLFRSRVKTLTDTEVSAVFNLGREAQWLAAMNAGDMPLNTVKMWVTAQDELVCPVCRPLDGTTARLGASFEGVGVLVPPVHPNCRCIVVPVEDKSVADFSRSKQRLIFPAQEVAKHQGGSDGTDDHPSGTSQDVHSGGSKKDQEDPGFSPKWTNSDIADDWVRFTTPELRRGETEVHRAFLNDIRTAEKIPELYRGINFNLQESDFSNKELKKSLKKWTTEGKTFNLPLSSFTANITDGFGYAMRGADPGIMFVVENARGIRVNAKESAEYKDDKFVDAVNARNEHVTRGKFKVRGVKEGPKGVTFVAIEQIDIPEIKNPIKGKLSKKMGLEETLARTLGTPLSSQDEISKHLIGRHDQKKHGRKGHGRDDHDGIGFELSRSGEGLSSDEMTTLFTTAGIATAVLFRQAAPLTTVKSLANPVQTLKRNGQYLKGMASWVTDGSKQFRIFLEGHRIYPEHTRMFTAFADGLDQLAKRPTQMVLHRGMTIPKTQPKRPSIESFTLSADQLRPGHTFDMAPSSFTRSKGIASSFTEAGSMKHGTERVVLHVDRGSNSARIADVSPMPWEREYVGWGTYRIDRVVTNAKGVRDVYVTQTQTYSLGHLARNPPPITKKPRPTASPKKTAAKLDEDLDALEASMEQLLASMGKPSYLS